MRADGAEVDLQSMLPTFQAAFEKVWFGEMENDEFNRLVLAAGPASGGHVTCLCPLF